MNIPYIVSLPLLIQDIESWQTSGIAGLQSAVLYAFPELDRAIHTIPLGDLVGDRVELLPNRLDRLTGHQSFSLRQIVSLSFL
jgi:magnesium chelatase subunit H